ncbi:hypothetical protein PABY_07400 [Pyrodictium abyssi]|uniref:Uncharacterized protein n=1 Tax=Pyrodictium abyssi TaxID=54256 RepID=A0ABM8IYK4_9CREN|nr:hypothetical protein PABY_07400 [Pyrodictium abyssi]
MSLSALVFRASASSASRTSSCSRLSPRRPSSPKLYGGAGDVHVAALDKRSLLEPPRSVLARHHGGVEHSVSAHKRRVDGHSAAMRHHHYVARPHIVYGHLYHSVAAADKRATREQLP